MIWVVHRVANKSILLVFLHLILLKVVQMIVVGVYAQLCQIIVEHPDDSIRQLVSNPKLLRVVEALYDPHIMLYCLDLGLY